MAFHLYLRALDVHLLEVFGHLDPEASHLSRGLLSETKRGSQRNKEED